MTTPTKLVFAGVAVLGVLGGLAFFGLTPFGKIVVQQIAGSTTGSTFNSAKVAEVVMAPTSATATSSSILNTDASDRIIDSAFVSCIGPSGSVFAQTGAGLANWTWQAATTSTAAPAVLTNTNLALNVNVATSSTDDSYIATSTYTKVITRRWAAGSYLTFTSNATSSTSGYQCQPGVYYHAS